MIDWYLENARAVNLRDGIRINGAVYLNTFLFLALVLAMVWRPEGDDMRSPNDGALPARLAYWLDRRVRWVKGRRMAQSPNPTQPG